MSAPWIHHAPDFVRQRPRETGAISIGLLLTLIVLVSFVPNGRTQEWPTAVARREAFTQSLVETGSVSASRLMVYSSTVPGVQTKIVEIVPEGASVKPGDLLVRFETAGFEQELARERAALQRAQADLQRAREDSRLASLRLEADADQARQQVGYAESALTNQLDGRGKLEAASAEAAAAEAARELDRARVAFEDMKPLLKEGFVTKAELDRAEQHWQYAADQQRLADLKREATLKYERPAAADRARQELALAREGLRRQKDSAAVQRAQHQASVALAQSHVSEIAGRIDLLERRIAGATIRADVPGLVVYRDLFFGSDKRKPQVGDEVWPNQPLIALPDTSQLTVDTHIREVDLHRLQSSPRVLVKVDAYPDLTLPGSIALVGALAQDDATRAGTKFFPVTVRIEASDARLRTGMTATVEIEVAAIPDAVVVPVQAVFDRIGQPYCVVLRRERPERRAVTLAGDNELSAAISSGVEAGDTVLLVEPANERVGR